MSASTLRISSVAPSVVASIYCPSCSCERPPTQFRIVERATGRRSRHCNSCHAAREKLRKLRLAKQIREARLHEAWSTISRAEARRLAIERFLLELVRRHGGPSGLARDWHEALREATAAKRLRACESLVVLLDHIQAHCRPSELLDDMALTNEHRRAKAQVILEALRDEPEMVQQLAARNGFKLARH